MITIEKIKKFINRKYWRYRNSAHFGTKIRNEVFLLFHRKESIVVDGWLIRFQSNYNISNWGDDINVYFIELITGKKVIPAQTLFFSKNRKKYCCIGTIIPQCVGKRSIIWGSGCGLVEKQLLLHPQEVRAVRGPITRNYLLENNIKCPEVYGDPALLLPEYYQPKMLCHKKVGLIPHHQDWDKDIDQHIVLPQDWIMINLSRYEKWTDVIDQICSCDLILSASLHGLIVSDAYHIPNVFTEFEIKQPNYTKYQDYFLSVNRIPYFPYQYKDITNLDKIEQVARETLSQVRINTTQLKSACPFIE